MLFVEKILVKPTSIPLISKNKIYYVENNTIVRYSIENRTRETLVVCENDLGSIGIYSNKLIYTREGRKYFYDLR